MNLFIQNINKNTNYAMMRTPKMTFNGYHLKPDAFTAEHEIVEKIRTMPDNIFKERAEFLKFCKSIDITPKISRVITKRLVEVRQTKEKFDDNVVTYLIESSKRVIQGYKWLLNNGKELLKEEIAEIKEIISDSKLPQDIKDDAKVLLEKNLV